MTIHFPNGKSLQLRFGQSKKRVIVIIKTRAAKWGLQNGDCEVASPFWQSFFQKQFSTEAKSDL
jgi:hypothetical protein